MLLPLPGPPLLYDFVSVIGGVLLKFPYGVQGVRLRYCQSECPLGGEGIRSDGAGSK